MSLIADAASPPAYKDRLFQNYPNPFNPMTTIEYSVAGGGHVDMKIFNIQGQRIRTLVDEHKQPGRYKVLWDGTNDAGRAVATGIYFYRIRTSSFVSVKKMLILR
jgi:flagellar hook assembly protein FlgD